MFIKYLTSSKVLFCLLLATYLAPPIYGAEIFTTLLDGKNGRTFFLDQIFYLSVEYFGLDIIFYFGFLIVALFSFISAIGFSEISKNCFIGFSLSALVMCGVFADSIFTMDYFYYLLMLCGLLIFNKLGIKYLLLVFPIILLLRSMLVRNKNVAIIIFNYPVAFSFILLIFLCILIYQDKQKKIKNLIYVILASLVTSFPWFVHYVIIFSGFLVLHYISLSGLDKSSRLAIGLEKLEDFINKIPALGAQWIMLCLIILNSAKLYRITNREILLPGLAINAIEKENLKCKFSFPENVSGYVKYKLFDKCPSLESSLVENAEFALLSKLSKEYEQMSADNNWQLFFQGTKPIEWLIFKRKH